MGKALQGDLGINKTPIKAPYDLNLPSEIFMNQIEDVMLIVSAAKVLFIDTQTETAGYNTHSKRGVFNNECKR